MYERDSRAQRGKPTAVPIGDLLPAALRTLGMPSVRLTRRVHDAWASVAEPAWQGIVRPLRLEGGVLVLGVDSSSLRQELVQFHHQRLLAVLRAALPDLPLVALRFTADVRSSTADDKAAGVDQ